MRKFLIIWLFMAHSCVYAVITCAVSIGYPPYQYVENERPKGIDPQLVELLSKLSDLKIKLRSMPWKTAVAKLYYTDELDCVFGMEISPKRKDRFLLSRPLYRRKSALFVLPKTNVESYKDLRGKVIIGDKSSALDIELREAKVPGLRIRESISKEESYKLLVKGRVFGVVLPYAVGKYLSQTSRNKIKEVMYAKEDTPVAIAVKKGNTELLKKIEDGLKKLPKAELEKIIKPWKCPALSTGVRAK